MFVVGMELDLKVLKNRANDAVVVSHASIIVPFALGMVLAYFIYESFAPEGVQFASFGLFSGDSNEYHSVSGLGQNCPGKGDS